MSDIDRLFDYLDKPSSEDNGDLLILSLRHGESEGQINKGAYKLHGDDKIPLTPKGSAQAVASGQIMGKLAYEWGLPPITILTSTGKRASATAREIFRKVACYDMNTTMQSDIRLDKQKFGAFDGHFTDAEREKHCGDLFHKYQRELSEFGPFYVRPPGGESIADVRSRFNEAVMDIKRNPGPYIVVTHGTNTLCLESILLNRDEQWVLDNVDRRGNCEIRMITGNDRRGYTVQNVCRDPLTW